MRRGSNKNLINHSASRQPLLVSWGTSRRRQKLGILAKQEFLPPREKKIPPLERDYSGSLRNKKRMSASQKIKKSVDFSSEFCYHCKMIITACGDGCFKIQTGGITIMTEPSNGELSNRFKPDIILKNVIGNERPFPQLANPFSISGPGEYEVKGVEIFAYPQGAYLVKAEDLKLGFLQEAVTVLEPLEEVDILFVPVLAETEKVVKQLEPKIVIPTTKNGLELAKVFNQKPAPQDKLTIKKKEVPATGPQIIMLTS